MGICKRHLNWTLILGLVAMQSLPYSLPTIVTVIITGIGALSLQAWYLYQKKRSYFFLVLPPIILLFLANKRTLGSEEQ